MAGIAVGAVFTSSDVPLRQDTLLHLLAFVTTAETSSATAFRFLGGGAMSLRYGFGGLCGRARHRRAVPPRPLARRESVRTPGRGGDRGRGA